MVTKPVSESFIQDTESAREAEDQLVVFGLGGEEYGIDILQVQEIIRLTDITSVPQTPACVEGVINLRGQVIPVIDLRIRFGMPADKTHSGVRIIVADCQGQTLGIIVDAVREVLSVPKGAVESPPELLGRADDDHIRGIIQLENRLVLCLDLGQLTDQIGSLKDSQESDLKADLEAEAEAR